MATKVDPEPLLSDRTIRYGRAVAIWGSISLVFLYLPGVNLGNFKPFGFEFTSSNEGWVWLCVLFVVLYNFIIFAEGFYTDRLHYLERSTQDEYHESLSQRDRSQEESQGNYENWVDDIDYHFEKKMQNYRQSAFDAYRRRLLLELPIPILIGTFSTIGILVRICSIFST